MPCTVVLSCLLLTYAIVDASGNADDSCLTDIEQTAKEETGQLGLLQARQVRKHVVVTEAQQVKKHAVITEEEHVAQPVTENATDVLRQMNSIKMSLPMHQMNVKGRNVHTADGHVNRSALGLVPATGAGVALTEAGYNIVAMQCCNWEMSEFISRVIGDMGYKVCTVGDLHGITSWYSCERGPRSLEMLQAEIIGNAASECPWVALKDESCPTKPDTCPVFPGNVSQDCGCSRGDSFNIDFFQSTVGHSNLGGLGPDAGVQELRYTNIGTFNGDVLDLVITADSNYASTNPNSSGKRGKFGTINVVGGASPEMTFSIVKTGTNTPVQLGELAFTMHDIDESKQGKMTESIFVKDFNAFVMDKGVEFVVDYTADGRTFFQSRIHGTGCDNPSDPDALGPVTCKYDANAPTPPGPGYQTIDQRKRSLMLVFKQVSSFKVTLDVSCVGVLGSTSCEKGRNFLFSGSSSLKDRCAA